MNFRWMALLALGFLAVSASAQNSAAPAGPKPAAAAAPATPKGPTTPKDPATAKDKTSYAIGVQVAMSLKSQGIDVDPAMVASGFNDALSGGKLLMTEQDLGATLNALQQQIKQKQTELLSKMADDNKKAGDTFFAENAKKEGVVTLPSGLQYK